MSHKVCPWWLGRLLASPARRLVHDPAAILPPFVTAGMTVLEPGPGMGFFTLELARLVGPRGKVVAVDVQPRMLSGLRRRAAKAGLLGGTFDCADNDGAVALSIVKEEGLRDKFRVEIKGDIAREVALLAAVAFHSRFYE